MYMAKKTKRSRPKKGKIMWIKKKEYEFPDEIKCPSCHKYTLRIKLKLRKNYPYGKKNKARKSIKEKFVFCINKNCMYQNVFTQSQFGESVLKVIS